MKVGDRIDVFKVLTDGGYPAGMMIPGTYRAKIGMYERLNSLIANGYSAGLMRDDEATKIGTLIIKTIK